MAADGAADTQLMLGVGLIGEHAGALPSGPQPSSASAWAWGGPSFRPRRWGGRDPLHVGPGQGAARPGLLRAGVRPAAAGPSALGALRDPAAEQSEPSGLLGPGRGALGRSGPQMSPDVEGDGAPSAARGAAVQAGPRVGPRAAGRRLGRGPSEGGDAAWRPAALDHVIQRLEPRRPTPSFGCSDVRLEYLRLSLASAPGGRG